MTAALIIFGVFMLAIMVFLGSLISICKIGVDDDICDFDYSEE